MLHVQAQWLPWYQKSALCVYCVVSTSISYVRCQNGDIRVGPKDGMMAIGWGIISK